MLFELGGRRKRFIQVIYVFLALLLGGSLVIFGIGGDADGGLGNAIGLDPNGSGSSGNDLVDQDIDEANATLASDPDNQEALLQLAKSQFSAGQTAINEEEFEAASTRYDAAITAWERYRVAVGDGKPKDPEEEAIVATLVLQAYGAVADSQPRLERAVEAAQLVAVKRPSSTASVQLALFAYAAGDNKTAEEAGKQALADADASTRSQIQAQLKQAKQQGKQIQQQLQAEAPTEDDLQNPLGGLGGAGGGATIPQGSLPQGSDGGASVPPGGSGGGQGGG